MSHTPEEIQELLRKFWALSDEERAKIRGEQLSGLDRGNLVALARLKTVFEDANNEVKIITDPFLMDVPDELGGAFAQFVWEFYQVAAVDTLKKGALPGTVEQLIKRDAIEKFFVVALACGWELSARYHREIDKDQTGLD